MCRIKYIRNDKIIRSQQHSL